MGMGRRPRGSIRHGRRTDEGAAIGPSGGGHGPAAYLLLLLASALALALALAGAAYAGSGPSVTGALPTITGPTKDGLSVKVAKGLWNGQTPLTYTYRWERCDSTGGACEAIPGAVKGSYRATHVDVGHTFRVVVTATNELAGTSATAEHTAVVVAAPPVRASYPKLTGVAKDGQALSAGTGTWKGTPPFSYSYRWEDCNLAGESCSIVPGAEASTYRPSTAQIGTRVRGLVTATNAVGFASAQTVASRKIVPGPPVNLAPPTIAGSLQDGQTLTAGEGSWAGTAPLSFSYQWARCPLLGGGPCEAIAGATESTYSLAASDIASKLTVTVTAANGLGSASATSAETQPVLAILPSNTLPPSITGLLQDGQLLSIGTGVWSGSGPISYSYQWQLCGALGGPCADISQATGSTLRLSPADIGGALQVLVTATNAAGSATVLATVTSLVSGLLPANTSAPSISGVLQDGQLLGTVTGSWSGSGPISYSYQWQECNASGEACSNISAATGATLSLITGLIGSTVDVVVTATNVAGSTSVTTPASGLIGGLLPSNTSMPSVSGLLQDGQLLSAVAGTWSGSAPISYSYQWQQCNAAGKSCSNISGATGSTLTLLTGLIGSTVDVVVTATNAAGSTSATASPTGLVAGLLPSNTALPSITGALKLGQTLGALAGTWSGTAPITYTYQWQLCEILGKSCRNIVGATSPSLVLGVLDVGLPLRVVVTASNVAGSTPATSAVTGLISAL